MLNTKINIFENKNLNPFVSKITETVTSAIENFWEQSPKVTLLAINNFIDFRSEKFVTGIDFFSSKISVEGHKPFIIRLSKESIKTLLDLTLDGNYKNLSLRDLTPLEVKILNSFSEFLYKKVKDLLVPTQKITISENSEKYVNMIFLAQINDDTCFKFSLSAPIDRLKFETLAKKVNFSDDNFLKSCAFVRVRAGKTKVALDDLENLSLDDIVLLEDSNATKLTLISGDFEKEFNVKADPSLVIDLGGEVEEEIDVNNEVTMEKNLWDDIQIEVNAEFEKVKMTIGEIKQITQGQIVDLGSVFNNEISLFVENKKVAKGELIIINDRYAVKLTEVLSKLPNQNAQAKPAQSQAQPAQPQSAQKASAPPRQPQAQAQPQSQPIQSQKSQPQQAAPAPAPTPQKPQPKPPPKPVEDENFDYSDFEK